MSEPNFILVKLAGSQSSEDPFGISRASSMGKTSLYGHWAYHDWCEATGRSHEDCPFCAEQKESSIHFDSIVEP